jgi:hypothetical protein
MTRTAEATFITAKEYAGERFSILEIQAAKRWYPQGYNSGSPPSNGFRGGIVPFKTWYTMPACMKP